MKRNGILLQREAIVNVPFVISCHQIVQGTSEVRPIRVRLSKISNDHLVMILYRVDLCIGL